jgi:hypothetical protein
MAKKSCFIFAKIGYSIRFNGKQLQDVHFEQKSRRKNICANLRPCNPIVPDSYLKRCIVCNGQSCVGTGLQRLQRRCIMICSGNYDVAFFFATGKTSLNKKLSMQRKNKRCIKATSECNIKVDVANMKRNVFWHTVCFE